MGEKNTESGFGRGWKKGKTHPRVHKGWEFLQLRRGAGAGFSPHLPPPLYLQPPATEDPLQNPATAAGCEGSL